MSAPDTNTEKQAEAHKAPIRFGIILPIVFAVGLLAVLIVVMFLRGNDPETATDQVDSRTGDVVDTQPAD